MKLLDFLSKQPKLSTAFILGVAILYSCAIQAQTNVRNSRPTLNPISDLTTNYSPDLRFIELDGITPGDETDQQVSIEVTTGDQDMIESIGADLVDNGKAFIQYQLKQGAVGTATIKVVVTDNGKTPVSTARTFRIIVDPLNRDLDTVSIETSSQYLKANPNPAFASTRLYISTPHDEQLVTVDLFTLSGVKMKQLFTGKTIARQSYTVDVNSKNLASGVYIVRLTSQSYTSTLRLVVAK